MEIKYINHEALERCWWNYNMGINMIKLQGMIGFHEL